MKHRDDINTISFPTMQSPNGELRRKNIITLVRWSSGDNDSIHLLYAGWGLCQNKACLRCLCDT